MTARLFSRGSPQVIAGAGAFADRQIDVFQDGEAAKQLIDLKRAGDAAAGAAGLRQRRDLLAVEQDFDRPTPESCR